MPFALFGCYWPLACDNSTDEPEPAAPKQTNTPTQTNAPKPQPVKPKNKAELQALVKDINSGDLSYINTSDIIDMSELFKDRTNFNADISQWDNSKVTDMNKYVLRCH